MTKIYKAGEHVKIIKSDPGYSNELGDQTGLVGTVKEGNNSGHAYVTFPHTGDASFYYLASEIEQVGTPAVEEAPEAEPAFKTGEYVKIVVTEGYGSDYRNTPLKVRNDAAAGSSHVEVYMVPRQGGAPWKGTLPVSAVVKTEAPAPEKVYLFRKGDHVRFVAGHNPDWTGAEFIVREDLEKGVNESPWFRALVQLTVTKPAKSGYYVGATTQVGAHKLVKYTPAPEPEFKVGDWVQVKGYSAPGSVWEGFIGQVTSLPHYEGAAYIINNGKGGAFTSGGFEAKYLVAAEKPFEPKFKLGDWVKVTNYYSGSSWIGTVGKVIEVPTEEGACYTLEVAGSHYKPVFLENEISLTTEPKPEPKFAVGDWVKVHGRNDKYDGIVGQIDSKAWANFWGVTATDGEAYTFAEDKLKATEKSQPKFKRGDWVEVHGRGDSWDGRKATIKSDKVDYDNFWIVQLDGKSGSEHRAHFQESKLKATEKPWTPAFKVGDWVEITGWGNSNGEKLQVKSLPTSKDKFYRFEDKDSTFGFRELYLKATEAPHWTEAKPVGTATRIGDRTLVKLEEDKWLFVYDTNSERASTSWRDNRQTKNLFMEEPAKFSKAF